MYSTGTLTLANGSTAVTGVGTLWNNVLRQGWLILIPGEPPLLVDGVGSNTALTLARPYQGTTRSGVTYNAIPTRGELATFLAQLQTVITAMQGTIDGAGAGKFADGTVAIPGMRFAADEDTGFWRPGANALNIVTGGANRLAISNAGAVLTGLLSGTAVTQSASDATVGRLLKVGDFGLGGQAVPPNGSISIDDNTLASGLYRFDASLSGGTAPSGTDGLWLHVRRENGVRAHQIWLPQSSIALLLRFWSGSSWSPWRPLVPERGSNANGEFTRYADGTLECFRTLTASSGAGVTWTFPAAFAAAPVVNGSVVATVLSAVQLDAAPSATAVTLSARDKADARRADVMHLTARGRWF